MSRTAVPAALLVLLTLLALPTGARAQSPLLVPSWDPVYQDVDRLVDAGLLPEATVGQRPWSARRLARVAGQAASALDAAALPDERREHLRTLVHRVTLRAGAREPGLGDDRLGDERFAVRVFAEAYAADARVRSSPYTGIGRIEDATAPLLAHRHGRPLDARGAAVLEPSVDVALHPRIGLHVRPRLHLTARGGHGDPGASDGVDTGAGVQSLYARGVLGNLAVLLGRSDVLWGRHPSDGLLLSGNPRPLDMLHLSNDLPFRLGFLGPTSLSFFAADLGEDQAWPHTKLFGGAATVRPVPRLELTFSVLNEQGGEGGPEADFWDRVADILMVPDLFITESDFQFSEKLVGGSVRWWPPVEADLALWLEGAVTDLDVRRVGSMVTHDAAWTLGAELSGLGARGAGWARLSGTRVGTRMYRHEQFPTGLTLDGAVLGSPLGPAGDGLRVAAGWEDEGARQWRVTAAWESRSADAWSFDPDRDPVFVKVEDRPEETRLRLRAGVTLRSGASWLEIAGGVERVQDFGFVEGAEDVGALLLVRASHGIGL